MKRSIIEVMREVVPDEGWEDAARATKGRVCLVMGKSDTGKTAFVRYALSQLLKEGGPAAFVDSDVGQSTLGLPGTVSAIVLKHSRDLAVLCPDSMRFVGTISPARDIPGMIAAVKALVERARSQSIQTVIVDTTGLADGEAGKALKLGKIRAVHAGCVVALQRGDELEELLSLVEEVEAFRLPVSRVARRRTRAARIRYRNERLKEYFKGASDLVLEKKHLRFMFRGREFDIRISPVKKGTIVGLNRGEETLALGVFEEINDNALLVRAPREHIEDAGQIVLGDFFFS